LLVTHVSNVNASQKNCDRPTFPTELDDQGAPIPCFNSSADVATLTWWVDVHGIGEPSATLDSCPTPAAGSTP
jgi:hypothetical protein